MNGMNVLHVLTEGKTGGIEVLCKDYAQYSRHNSTFVIFWGKDDVITRQMRQNGTDVIELDLPRGVRLEAIGHIHKICREKKIDVIVVHHSSPITHMIIYAVKLMNPAIKIVSYAHSFAQFMAQNGKQKGLFLRKCILRFALSRSSKVVAISAAVKDSVVDYFGTKEEKIQVVYNGVDLSCFRELEYKPENRPVQLIYVGRLIEEKGVQVVLQNLTNLLPAFDYRFQIVGDGPYREELEKLTAELNLGDRVQFLGMRTDVPQLLEKADVFVHMPTCEEGFGIAVVEAMAAGLICICAKSGGIPEIISDGLDGFLVEKNSTTAVADKIRMIAAMDSQARYAFGMRAKEKGKRFSIESFADTLDSVLSNIR